MSLADCINLAIAICTAAAALAAWVSASASLKATEQANKEAEESRKIAQKQLEDRQDRGRAPEPDKREKLAKLKLEQTHLGFWLDRQTDALGVGLGFKCPGSPYNDKIEESA
jgi:hypothetical protein